MQQQFLNRYATLKGNTTRIRKRHVHDSQDTVFGKGVVLVRVDVLKKRNTNKEVNIRKENIITHLLLNL